VFEQRHFYAFITRLTVEERVFILESYLKTMSYAHCRQSFFEKFRRQVPVKSAIAKMIKNANHPSLIRNNVVPCICLRVTTYAWSDVTRNAGIRKTNRATRYVGPCIFAHAFNDVTYMTNEYNVHIADGC